MVKVIFSAVIFLSITSLASSKDEIRKPNSDSKYRYQCEDKALTVARFLQNIESPGVAVVKIEITQKTPAQGEAGSEEFDILFYAMGKGNKLVTSEVAYRISTLPDSRCTITGVSRPNAG